MNPAQRSGDLAPARSWSLDELRQATRLAYGTSRAGQRPNLAALAAAAGVSHTTAKRWLAGAQRPSPHNALQLRRALLPDPKTLSRQADEHAWASRTAATMAAASGRGVTAQWRAQGWHTPHDVFLLHHADLGLNRATVALSRRTRSLELPPGWSRTDVVELANRPTALLLKHALLEAMASWRVNVRPGLLVKGHSECWLDTGPTPSLTALAVERGWR